MSKVTLIVKPWAGDHAVAPEDAEGLFVDAVEVDGFGIDGFTVRARLTIDVGDFGSIVIPTPPDDLRARYTDPGGYIVNDEATLSLPITELAVRVVTP